MIKAGVREVRQKLSEYLRKVQEGEEVVITRRDEPLARIVPFASKQAKSLESHKGLRERVATSGKPLSQIVMEQREERF